jgi:multiple sugar transport system permease protein
MPTTDELMQATPSAGPVDPAPARRRPARRARWNRRNTGLLVLGLVLGALTVLPLVVMLLGSFKPEAEVTAPTVLPQEPTFENYVYVFTEVPFLRYLLNSAFISGVITVLALWFHSMAAYALARLRFPGREAIFLVIFSTLLVSLPVVMVPTFAVVRTLGMVDSYAGLIVPAIFNAFGIFLLRQFYISIPAELEEAALLDGAGYWRVYWSVILPLSRPILSALTVFFFLANWNSFVWPLTITSDPNLRTVQVGIASFQLQYSGNWNYTLAAATVAALPMLALFFFFQRHIVESIKSAGFK